MDVQQYSMFEYGLPHDLMHDLLEGLAPHEIKLMLLHYTSNGTFTLQEFNERLIHFNFGYTEKDKPLPLLNTILKSNKKICASASQILLLVRIMPFLIADKIPEDEDHWACFQLLKSICDIVFSPVVTENFCSSLKLLIRDHHLKFVELYGTSSYIPKMHFLSHYPEQMSSLGPMLNTWTMRYEAKLRFYKRASHLSNFKNIALSLANRHQNWMCYEMSSGHLILNHLECGPLQSNGLIVDESENLQEQLKFIIPQLKPEATISRPRWIKMEGILYKADNAYVIIDTDGLDPIFGEIIDILVVSNYNVIFQVIKYQTLFFCAHYHSYAVKATFEQLLFSNLSSFDIHHGHKLSDGLKYIYT